MTVKNKEKKKCRGDRKRWTEKQPHFKKETKMTENNGDTSGETEECERRGNPGKQKGRMVSWARR